MLEVGVLTLNNKDHAFKTHGQSIETIPRLSA